MKKPSAIPLFLALLCALSGAACRGRSPDAQSGGATSTSTEQSAGEHVVRIPFSPATGSSLAFVGTKVTQSHEGRFERFSGEIEVVNDSIEGSRVTARIDLGSVSIAPDELGARLRTSDFFDVARFPQATFRSISIQPAIADGQTHLVTGELELHGIKKQIRFPAAIALSPGGVRASADFVIDRQAFGIVYPGLPDDLIRDEVRIRFDVRAPVQ